MNQVSFLLGSGFSIPADIRSTKQINSAISNIKADELMYGGDEFASFLFGKRYPNNAFEHLEERKFVEQFLNFYTTKIIGSKDKFHYEDFYDYFMQVYKEKNIDKSLKKFFSEFEKENPRIYGRPFNFYLEDFSKIFPQLIKSLLFKNFEKTHLAGPYTDSYEYSNFLNLIVHLSKDHIINIHTLNHDLLMERFNYTDAFKGEMVDGFTTNDSNLYGKLEIPSLRDGKKINLSLDPYYVRLPIFVNKYESGFRLYKLHGSIDRYRIYYENNEFIVKLLNYITPFDIVIEVDAVELKQYKDYSSIFVKKVADFLTGTEYKITQYPDEFYQLMFKYFKDNLDKSKYLIVIGYGFGDKVVNEYVSDFVKDKTKKMIVINKNRQNLDFETGETFEFLPGGVEKFKLTDLISLL